VPDRGFATGESMPDKWVAVSLRATLFLGFTNSEKGD